MGIPSLLPQLSSGRRGPFPLDESSCEAGLGGGAADLTGGGVDGEKALVIMLRIGGIRMIHDRKR